MLTKYPGVTRNIRSYVARQGPQKGKRVHKVSYRARIYMNKHVVHLGEFPTLALAQQARLRAERLKNLEQ